MEPQIDAGNIPPAPIDDGRAPPPEHDTSPDRRISSIAGLFFVFLVAAGMIAWTWGGWPDVLVDFGRELYVPWRILNGETLYRDIAYLNGPLSPYLNGLWFMLGGASLRTLVFANIALAAIILWLLHRLLTRIGGPVSAAAACIVAACAFMFSFNTMTGNYNFVCPYSHELTHGTLISLTVLASLDKSFRTRSIIWLIFAGLATGAALLTKPEIVLALFLGVTAYAVSLRREWIGRPVLAAKLALTMVASAALPPVVATTLLSLRMPFQQALNGVLTPYSLAADPRVSSMHYYREIAGFENIGANLVAIVLGTVAIAAFLLPAIAAAWVAPRRGLAHWAVVGACAVLPVVVVAVLPAPVDTSAAAAAFPVNYLARVDWLRVLRPLPLLLGLAFLVCRPPRPAQSSKFDAGARANRSLSAALTAFSAGLLAKMLLNVQIHHYGFALAMPAAALLVVALLDGLPRALASRGGAPAPVRAAAGCMIALFLTGTLNLTRVGDEFRSVSIGAGPDAFRTDWRGKFVNEISRELERRMKPGETFAVIPEGATLNFLLRRPNGTPFTSFLPLEMFAWGEPAMIAALDKARPACIVLPHKGAAEYGRFGKDYGQSLVRWIETNYRRDRTIGSPPFNDRNAFGVTLAVRRDLP